MCASACPRRGVLRVAAPVRGDVPGVPHRDRVHGGRVAEHVDDLERGGLLSLDAHRVHRVDHLDARAFPELAHDLERAVEVAVHRHDPRAVDERLRELPERDLALRDHDRAHQPGARRVGGGRRRRVAGGRADHDLGAPLDRDGDRHGHAAVLERPGRVEPLHLEVRARDARLLRDARRLEQRRVALEQRDHRRGVGDGQVLAVLLDRGPGQPCSCAHSSSPITRRTAPTRWTCSTSRSARTVSRRSDSLALWVTKMRRASSPLLALLHRADRHAELLELLGDGAQHARAVGHFHHQVELRLDVVDGADRLRGQRAHGRALASLDQVLRRVDEVAEHRRGGRHAARAPAVEHELAHRVALDEHRVERVAHRRERVPHRDHRGVDAHRDLAVELLRHREQLHDVAEVARRRDVVERDLGDALAVHVAGDDARAERDRRDDRGLGRGVEALDVGGGVGLGEPERLRLRQRVGERRAGVGHVGEDVVGGAVDDAHHPADAVAGERLAQRADERDATADRRLEEDVDARALGGLEQLPPVGGDELLVGGDHRLAAHQRLDDEAAGGLDAADDLHHDVDVGVVDHRSGVVGEAPARQRQVAVLGEVVHRHPGHLERHAGARLDHVGVVVDEAHECTTHVTTAEDPDPYPLVHQFARVSPHRRTGRSLPQTRRHARRDRRTSRAGRPRGPARRARTRPPGAARGCSSTPSSGRTRR